MLDGGPDPPMERDLPRKLKILDAYIIETFCDSSRYIDYLHMINVCFLFGILITFDLQNFRLYFATVGYPSTCRALVSIEAVLDTDHCIHGSG